MSRPKKPTPESLPPCTRLLRILAQSMTDNQGPKKWGGHAKWTGQHCWPISQVQLVASFAHHPNG